MTILPFIPAFSWLVIGRHNERTTVYLINFPARYTANPCLTDANKKVNVVIELFILGMRGNLRHYFLTAFTAEVSVHTHIAYDCH